MAAAFTSVKTDPFGGVTVTLSPETPPPTATDFEAHLIAALDEWEAAGKRGIWLDLPLEASELVPVAVSLGFVYHHAGPEGAVLTLWLPEDEPNALPAYPTIGHGVGGIVVNSRDEVLGIQEKRGVTAGMTEFWKIPGGLVDQGEDLHLAAVREVLEETGLRTKFVSMVGMREAQTGPFGTTDCYCVCVMALDEEAYDGDIPSPSPQEQEIANTAWIPAEQFLKSSAPPGSYGALIRLGVAAARSHQAGGKEGMQVMAMKGRGKAVESMYYVGGGNAKDIIFSKL